MKKNIFLSLVFVFAFLLVACGAPATEAAPAGQFEVHSGGEVVPTVQITIADGDPKQAGIQPVHNFSLFGFCKNEADETGREKICRPVVTVTAANGAAAIFSGAPGEVTTLPLAVLDDYRNQGTTVSIVSEEKTFDYKVFLVIEMQTGIQLALNPVQ